MLSEKQVEGRLVLKVKKLGGVAYKWTSPSNPGVPDRLVLYQGNVWLVELKAPGQKPRKRQLVEFERLYRLGFDVIVIDSYEGVDRLVEDMRSCSPPHMEHG